MQGRPGKRGWIPRAPNREPVVADRQVLSQHWLSAERLQLYPWALVIWYALVAWTFHSQAQGMALYGEPIGSDFIAYWTASDLALEGDPSKAYDQAAIAEVQRRMLPDRLAFAPWIYPPTFLLLVLPLALLPYLWSYLAFMAVTFAGCLTVLRRLAPRAAGVVLLLAFPGSFEVVVHGQNGFLSVALAGAGLLWLERRPVLAGVAFGLLTFKPQLGLLIPLALACAGAWRAMFSAAVTAVVFMGLSLAALGADTLMAFVDSVETSSRWLSEGHFRLIKMPTVFALLRLTGAGAGLALTIHLLVALLVAALVAVVWRRSHNHKLRAAVLTAGAILASPYFFDYDFIWLALPLAFVSADALVNGWRRGEREYLLFIWLLPLLVSQLHGWLPAPWAAIPLLGLFLLTVRRALLPARDAGIAAAQPPSSAL